MKKFLLMLVLMGILLMAFHGLRPKIGNFPGSGSGCDHREGSRSR